MENSEILINNLSKLHTTELGVIRIRKNLSLNTDDVVEWCREAILLNKDSIRRNGKNWYVFADDCIITVNAHSFTIITAHKIKEASK